MKSFDYTIKDEIGIHARPAGLLNKEAKKYSSTVTVARKDNGKSADVKKLMQLLALGIKCNDTIEVTVEGEDEEAAAVALEEFFKANL
ncbi:MAG: HPr family phosphocarrier protein [Lachnospiraceae bacterium]|nr:HPr family phosphocarrier protein [Lachnospiraceae bacterium]